MINYELHENGWTVMLRDFDFKTATQDDINQIAKLIANNTVVVARNQFLTIEDEVRIAKLFKEPQRFDPENSESSERHTTGCEIENSEGLFLRVTGEKNEHGLPGIAAHKSEMIWHCNDPGAEYRKPIVWLYGVRGTEGSRTTWNNNILSYQDLDDAVKNQIDAYHLEVVLESALDGDNPDLDYEISNYNPTLVRRNIAGKKGLFFPFLQVIKIKEISYELSKELTNWLGPYTVQEKYCYHHDWNNGDVVISEQNLGIHKRWRFENIENRLLHRGAFDFPDQDYSS
jgi:alpha-ketoglutarate-dependent taurine dioxygenase